MHDYANLCKSMHASDPVLITLRYHEEGVCKITAKSLQKFLQTVKEAQP